MKAQKTAPKSLAEAAQHLTHNYKAEEIQELLFTMFQASLAGADTIGLIPDERTDLATTYRHLSLLARDLFTAYEDEEAVKNSLINNQFKNLN